jgi:hypothetical protein
MKRMHAAVGIARNNRWYEEVYRVGCGARLESDYCAYFKLA